MHPRRSILLVIAVVAVLVAALFAGLLPRLARQRTLLAASHEENERVVVVNVTPVRRSSSSSDLTLPGNIDAMNSAPIYARADGYLRKLFVDIGDRVHEGQVLGEIETPELDQQLRQARAGLAQTQSALKQAEAGVAQARANLTLAKVTADRWKNLVAQGVASKQEGDEKLAIYDARKADLDAALANVTASQSNIAAQEANVQRITEMKAFDRFTAPFDGIITERNTTTGTLISAGTNSPNRELLRIAQIDTLRIFVSTPQTNAAAMRTDMDAEVSVQELPNRVFHGKIARTASSLEESSRTLRTEVRVRNLDHALLPGMYAQVRFTISGQASPLLIPGDALVVRSNGTQVAVVGRDSKVHFRKIQLGRDTGPELEVLHGLEEGEDIVINPTDEVREGATVQARPAPKSSK